MAQGGTATLDVDPADDDLLGKDKKEKTPHLYNEELRQGESVGSEVNSKVHSKAPRDRSRIEPKVSVLARLVIPAYFKAVLILKRSIFLYFKC